MLMDAWLIIKAIVVGLMLVVGFGLAAHTVYWLLRYVARGSSEPRLDSIGDRIRAFIVFALGQRRVIMEFGGVIHAFIFWGFLILQIETVEYMIRGFDPHFAWGSFICAGNYEFFTWPYSHARA